MKSLEHLPKFCFLSFLTPAENLNFQDSLTDRDIRTLWMNRANRIIRGNSLSQCICSEDEQSHNSLLRAGQPGKTVVAESRELEVSKQPGKIIQPRPVRKVWKLFDCFWPKPCVPKLKSIFHKWWQQKTYLLKKNAASRQMSLHSAFCSYWTLNLPDGTTHL